MTDSTQTPTPTPMDVARIKASVEAKAAQDAETANTVEGGESKTSDEPTKSEADSGEGKYPAWVTDGSFDPRRAYDTISHLRSLNQELKTEVESVKAKPAAPDSDRVPASGGDEAEELARLRAENSGLKEQLAERDTQELRVKALADVGIPLEYADFVKGSTTDEIRESVQRLIALQKSGAARSLPVDPAQVAVGSDDSDDLDAQFTRAILGHS